MTRTINTGKWMQEWHATQDKTARKRAAELRKLGYEVRCSNMGTQITEVGSLKMTMLDARPGKNEDTFGIPELKW